MVSLGCEIREKDRSTLADAEQLCSEEREEQVLLQRGLAQAQQRADDLEAALAAEKAASARGLQASPKTSTFARYTLSQVKIRLYTSNPKP